MKKIDDQSGPHKTPIPKSPARARCIAAAESTIEVHDRVRVAADRVARDIDDLTSPGVPIPIGEDDSIVTTIGEIIEQRQQRRTAGGSN